MPYFYDVSDDDGNEAVKGPFYDEEEALEHMDGSDLAIARPPYLSINKRAADSKMRSSGSRLGADQPLPRLPDFD